MPLQAQDAPGLDDASAAIEAQQARVSELRRAGDYDAALNAARQWFMVVKLHDTDHPQAQDARRMIATLEHITNLPNMAQAELRAADRAEWEARQLYAEGRHREAINKLSPHIGVRLRLLGADHPETFKMMSTLAAVQLGAGDLARAEPLLREVAAGYRRVLGAEHRDTLIVLSNLGALLLEKGQPAEAEVLAREVLAAKRRALGPEDPSTLTTIRSLAMMIEQQGRMAEAEQLSREALAGAQRALGDDHPDTVGTKFNLSGTLFAQSRFSEAEVLIRDVLQARRSAHGDQHPATLEVMNILGMLLERQGKLAEAEPLMRVTVERMRAHFGADHPATLHAVNNLSILLQGQGQYAEAEPLVRSVLEGYRRHLGDENANVLTAQGNVALVLHNLERYSEAETLNRQTLQARRRILGPDHFDSLTSRNNLAQTLLALDRTAEAEVLLREAHEGFRRAVGDDHQRTWVTCRNWANVLSELGRLAEAEPLLKQARDELLRTAGPDHRETLMAMHDLAGVWYDVGRIEDAAALLSKLSRKLETVRLALSTAGMQRIHMTGNAAPQRFLAVCLARSGQYRTAWEQLEAHLARGLLDTVAGARRSLTKAEHDQRRKLITALLALEESIAAGPVDASDAFRAERLAQRAVLTAERLRFEQKLERQYGPAVGRVCGLSEAQAQLSADEALVVWADLKGAQRQEHWACVIREAGDPTWIPLDGRGLNGAWTHDDLVLHERVRSALADPTRRADDDLDALYAQRLAPLEPALRGVRRLIVVPAGHMAGVPLEALADRYVVSYVPSATMFIWLSARQQPSANGSGAVLALGDPDFGDGESALPPLPGTRLEIQAIAQLFQDSARGAGAPAPTVLMGQQASEERIDRLTKADAMRHFRYVHLATHGLLNDAAPWRSALLLSKPDTDTVVEQLLGEQPVFDGRLTAEQILRGWQLDADLVTLSGCETALGQAHAGEGYLGFSQALFASGARSLLLSLWKVDDRATALLMQRFYQNLLGRFDQPRSTSGRVFAAGEAMTKSEALREAKAWLRGQSPQANRQALAQLGFTEAQDQLALARGGIRMSEEQPRTPYDFSHPHYWAAFILFGNPD